MQNVDAEYLFFQDQLSLMLRVLNCSDFSEMWKVKVYYWMWEGELFHEPDYIWWSQLDYDTI